MNCCIFCYPEPPRGAVHELTHRGTPLIKQRGLYDNGVMAIGWMMLMVPGFCSDGIWFEEPYRTFFFHYACTRSVSNHEPHPSIVACSFPFPRLICRLLFRILKECLSFEPVDFFSRLLWHVWCRQLSFNLLENHRPRRLLSGARSRLDHSRHQVTACWLIKSHAVNLTALFVTYIFSLENISIPCKPSFYFSIFPGLR